MLRLTGVWIFCNLALCVLSFRLISIAPGGPAHTESVRISSEKATGYRGIWYYNQKVGPPYIYKYSGGLGTYCAKHIPLAVYAPEVDRTFFVYGGVSRMGPSGKLQAMAGFYDHRSRTVPRPTVVCTKNTRDAHDNPVLSIDSKGYLWVLVSSHGTVRPSYIYRSLRPYSCEAFKLIRTTNFSYPQVWYIPEKGFLLLHTLYRKGRRLLHVSTSADGTGWSEPRLLAAMARGHYQVSCRRGLKIGTAFNYHPEQGGLNARTNLYYIESSDFGRSWRTAAGKPVKLPLTDPQDGETLVHRYETEGLLVYLKDLNFDRLGRPIILFLTSRGFKPGPRNGPRIWRTAHWTGRKWEIRSITTSDNNYDMGSLYVQPDGTWLLVAPTEPGPQRFNPGGEMAVWSSTDEGATWRRCFLLTQKSKYNHTYARRPVKADPGFYAFWADGDARKPSPSRLYFWDRRNETVYRLPESIPAGQHVHPEQWTTIR